LNKNINQCKTQKTWKETEWKENEKNTTTTTTQQQQQQSNCKEKET